MMAKHPAALIVLHLSSSLVPLPKWPCTSAHGDGFSLIAHRAVWFAITDKANPHPSKYSGNLPVMMLLSFVPQTYTDCETGPNSLHRPLAAITTLGSSHEDD